MRKSLERCNKAIRRLKGNEGFSLVELIIVVAIMVALVAILAPQYFQYVEKSRKSVDTTSASEILSAVKVITLDPDLNIPADFDVTWTVDGDGDGAVAVSATDDDVEAAIQGALFLVLGLDDEGTLNAKSNFAKTEAGVLTIAVDFDAFDEDDNPTGTNAYIFTITTPAWATELS